MLESFSKSLQTKIDLLKKRQKPIVIGDVCFKSNLILAPLSAICSSPYRLLMENLGAGGTVSELISCHGINYQNEKTLEMLKIHEREESVGIQLFGEDQQAMAKAIKIVETYNPKFIDINMGCPVRKVVTKGGGSALLRDINKLDQFFTTIKKSTDIPVSIKIRTGWDESSLNADQVTQIAANCGIEFVAIHGRTRTQQYKGAADWDYIEQVAIKSPLPIIGNGDLHSSIKIKERLNITNCTALMLGRGPLRNPFIFLETLIKEDDDIIFTPRDHFEVIEKFLLYMKQSISRERVLFIQLRKHVVWIAAGYPGASKFRDDLFKHKTVEEILKTSEQFFCSLENISKQINSHASFMTGGHG